MIRAAVLTISDGVSAGVREDTSGHLAVALIKEEFEVQDVALEVVPDERELISGKLRTWTDQDHYDLVVTSGGTGISPRDVTPQATMAVLDYTIPGFAEVMRAESFRHTPMAALSRAIAGVRGKTLIINLPGSPKAVRECLEVLFPVLPHALEQIAGGKGH